MPALSYLLPILLIVFSNTIYNIVAKATPSGASTFASLMITYLTASAATFILLLISCRQNSTPLAAQFGGLNWTCLALGVVIIGLEAGYLLAYRAGWNISVCSLVANISMAVLLLLIGFLFYKEQLTVNKLIGIVLCLTGLFFINKP